MKAYKIPKNLKDIDPLNDGLFLKNDSKTVSYAELKPIFDYLHFNQADTAKVFGVNESTISRWQKTPAIQLDKLKSRLIYEIDAVLQEGYSLFGSSESLQQWLNDENEALGNKKPADLLKDPYKVELVEEALQSLSWGNIL